MAVFRLYIRILPPQEAGSILQSPSAVSKVPCRLPAEYHRDGKGVWDNPVSYTHLDRELSTVLNVDTASCTNILVDGVPDDSVGMPLEANS